MMKPNEQASNLPEDNRRPPLAARNLNLPSVFLVRHGETEWSISGQHTGLTDLPLTARGERDAIELRTKLQRRNYSQVITSPLQRASRTCDLAGFKSVAIVDKELVEWNYGSYEGLTTAEIELIHPGWELFRDGCPCGDSVDAVAARADRVISRIRAVEGDVLIFSSAHFLRVLAARWLGLSPYSGRYFDLSTASLSTLGYEHNLREPVISCWNQQDPSPAVTQ